LANSQDKAAQARAEASFKRKEQQARDGKLATIEYEAAAKATREKTARLRALRLAKEAKEAAEKAAAGKEEVKPKGKRK
jgi:hypothetical protein